MKDLVCGTSYLTGHSEKVTESYDVGREIYRYCSPVDKKLDFTLVTAKLPRVFAALDTAAASLITRSGFDLNYCFGEIDLPDAR